MALDTNKAGVAPEWRRLAAALSADAAAAFGKGSAAARIVEWMRRNAVMKTLGSWRRYMFVLLDHVDPQGLIVRPPPPPGHPRRWQTQLEDLRKTLSLPPPANALAGAFRLGARGLGPEDAVRGRSRSRSPKVVYDVLSSAASSASVSSIPAGQPNPPTPPSPMPESADEADSPHRLLDVPYGVSPRSLRRAWRQAALRLHPDKGGDVDQFILVQNAAHQLGV